MADAVSEAAGHEMAVLGGGCFWCLEAAYQEVRGVEQVVSGYAGGQTRDPSYEQVVGGGTGHAEVVRVTFNPGELTYADVLAIFWVIHDPTTPNRQGNDVGPEYRSIILYVSEAQRQEAEVSRAAAQHVWPSPIVTEIEPLQEFYPAEAEHQDYFRRHPERAYCQLVINPKLAKLRAAFRGRLKQP